MSTSRLYYTDASCLEFEATVASCHPLEHATGESPRFAVTLDQTAFYPTSGGQPFDTGRLGPAIVHDVRDDEDADTVVHVVDQPMEAGASVRGVIDEVRRFDHRQQHTGQHILSAVFDTRYGVRTESFHLGTESSSIDLAREVTAGELSGAVAEANRVVWGDRPVTVRFVEADEAARLPLRKAPARAGRLRLIEIADCDLSACGGTHVDRTGGVGIIAVSHAERFRGGTRVTFLCGTRVLRQFALWRDALAATGRVLSVSPEELAPAIERLQHEQRQMQKQMRGLQEQLAVFEAEALAASAERAPDRAVVVRVMPGLDATALKAHAAALAAREGLAAALFSAESPVLVVVARHPSVPVDAGAVVKALIAAFGGRGGGRPDLAQGGGLTAAPDALVAAARALLLG
jgi:alanyl-tRNA synthetase